MKNFGSLGASSIGDVAQIEILRYLLFFINHEQINP